jgi:putative tricarboxylic transport membrane protein
MTEMKKRDGVTAMCWIILGSVITLWSGTFPFGSRQALGPAILPFVSGIMLIFLGIVVFFQAMKQNEKGSTTTPPLFPRGVALKRVALSLLVMFLSAVVLDRLGFVSTLFCMTLLLLRTVEPMKWRFDLFYSLAFTIGSYILFQVLLTLSLPRGFLGF